MSDLGQGDLGEAAPINPHRTVQLTRGHLWDEAGEGTHERRLAAAGGSAHEREGARPGGHVDPAQGLHSVPRQLAHVGERQGFNVNHGSTPR